MLSEGVKRRLQRLENEEGEQVLDSVCMYFCLLLMRVMAAMEECGEGGFGFSLMVDSKKLNSCS